VIDSIQQHLSNKLPEDLGGKLLAGIIGDRPSQYAKSPTIWNPAINALGLNAVYVPFDVDPSSLKGLTGALRDSEQYVGGSVTVPYKIDIIRYLDEVDQKARLIGAVNTVVRTEKGTLIGFNTDGQGGVDALTRVQPGQRVPFLKTLDGLAVLLLGAGGAAYALAFYLAEMLKGGRLMIVNRDETKAHALAKAVNAAYGNAMALSQETVLEAVQSADLVINASTRGQSGIRQLPGGLATCLEPYSALGKAIPTTLPESLLRNPEEFYRLWLSGSVEDILRNNAESLRTMTKISKKSAFFDIVYSPMETVLLRHARLAGYRTLNGKAMNIVQAASAFVHYVFRRQLAAQDLYTEKTFGLVLEQMYAVW